MAATIHWWNLACEVENKNYWDGVKARDDKCKELEKEGRALEKRADRIQARYADELMEWAND